MEKQWVFPPSTEDAVARLASDLRVAELTARVLVNRGLSDPSAAQRFLQPSLHELEDPCDHPVVTSAARFLVEAARDGKHITVFGDYDADGICAAALLMRCFAHIGARVDLYIPHRTDEGYGLSCEALAGLAEAGTNVVVTVDCGISALAEVERARELGMEMVITDHHVPGAELPKAAHVLNAKLPESRFGYEGLAGVGVAFKLLWAIGQELSPEHRVTEEFKELLMEALALVAVGSIADMVPLVDENRVLTHYGLHGLNAPTRPGLKALIAASRIRGARIRAEDVAFRLAPRLNAAGRMGDARAAVELLTTTDERHAGDLAEHLDRQNRLRRSTQQATMAEAEERLARDESLLEGACIVLADPNWHQGVVGLVASRLAEKHARPAFVFVPNGELATGSARSVPGLPLLPIVQQCSDLLERYGGHKAAAGMTIRVENLPAFTERVNELAVQAFGRELPAPQLELDGRVELADLNPDLVRELGRLEPFGKGNPEPVFAASGLQLAGNPRVVGSNANHLVFMVRQDRATLRVIAMNKADWLTELRARRGEPFSLAFQPAIDAYRGGLSVELRAQDLRWDA